MSNQWDAYWRNTETSVFERRIQSYKEKHGYKRLLDAVPEIGDTGRRALEVGAGRAWLSRLLKAKGWDTVAVDTDSYIAKMTLEKVNQYVIGDMYKLPFNDCSFDVVMSCGLIEHFSSDEVQKIIAEMGRIGRSVVAWLPSCGFGWKVFLPIRNAICGQVFTTLYRHKKNDLRRIFVSAGFKNVRTGSVVFAGFLPYIYCYGTNK